MKTLGQAGNSIKLPNHLGEITSKLSSDYNHKPEIEILQELFNYKSVRTNITNTQILNRDIVIKRLIN